jgi:phosphoglycerate dehydrogenase-like enzyme
VYWGNRLNLKNIKKMHNLKWVHYGSTGIDQKILKYANANNIMVTNTKRIFDNAVVSTTMSFIFMLARGINYSFILRNKKKLNRIFYNKITKNIQNVFDQKILLVGFSEIGKKIAKICHSMNMEITVVKNNILKNKINFKIYKLNQLNLAVKGQDYVINLLPFTKKTENIFDKKIFSNMKDSSFFINVGRGDTVNEDHLIDALKKKKILGVATDVVKNEPISSNSKLLKFDNVIATPHIAGISNDYWEKEYELFSNNLNEFLKFKKLKNSLKSKIGY